MIAIHVAQEDDSEAREKITIHTYSLTAVDILTIETGLKYNYNGHQRGGIQINTNVNY